MSQILSRCYNHKWKQAVMISALVYMTYSSSWLKIYDLHLIQLHIIKMRNHTFVQAADKKFKDISN